MENIDTNLNLKKNTKEKGRKSGKCENKASISYLFGLAEKSKHEM
jgi:hypothetical protein